MKTKLTIKELRKHKGGLNHHVKSKDRENN